MSGVGGKLREAVVFNAAHDLLQVFDLLRDVGHVGGLDAVAEDGEELVVGVAGPHRGHGGGAAAAAAGVIGMLPLHRNSCSKQVVEERGLEKRCLVF